MLGSNKIQDGDISGTSLTQMCLEKWPLKWRELNILIISRLLADFPQDILALSIWWL